MALRFKDFSHFTTNEVFIKRVISDSDAHLAPLSKEHPLEARQQRQAIRDQYVQDAVFARVLVLSEADTCGLLEPRYIKAAKYYPESFLQLSYQLQEPEFRAAEEAHIIPVGAAPLARHGMNNFGATCYANAAIRLLVTTPHLSTLLDRPMQQGHVVQETLRVIRDGLQSTSTNTKAMRRGVSEAVAVLMQHLGEPWSDPKLQQDPDEFLTTLLQHLDPEGTAAGLVRFEQMLLPEMHPNIPDIVLEPGTIKSDKLPILNLALGVSHTATSLQELLDLEMADEMVDEYNVYQQGAPDSPVGRLNQIPRHREFVDAPQSFTLNLKRTGIFQDLRGELQQEKNSRYVDPNLELFLTVSSRHTGEIEDIEYQLTACVTHLGENATSGHYVAFQRLLGGRWLCQNDDEVFEVNPYDAINAMRTGGYLFTYEKTVAR